MIQLYIGKQKADLDSSVSVSLIHKLENLSNPTDVNGSYSLTISLPGTKNNNKIFADYWKLDKYITQHTGNTTAGVDFSPINRVEASLYQNGDILLTQAATPGVQRAVGGCASVRERLSPTRRLYPRENPL